ncbi:MAG: hypothetical protein AB7L09_00165 [Nitrospira sp.]
MPLLDFVSKPTQRVAYLFPELTFDENPINQTTNAQGVFTGFTPTSQIKDVFVFQFWPQQVTDNYTPNYATKNVPGGSHPIFQWTGGSGRDISFTAQFVTEITEDEFLPNPTSDFRSRITASAALSPTTNPGGGFGLSGLPVLGPLLLPSSRYKTNVAAAVAALQRYLYPDYVDGGSNSGKYAKPPRKLILVLPGTKLGRKDGDDGILCIMRSAGVTMESWFPSGELRSVNVSLRFSEIVQRSAGAGNVSNINYISRTVYDGLAAKYTSTVTNPGELELSNI